MSTLFKTIRNVAMRCGISAPESDDDIYNPLLFKTIDKHIQSQHEEIECLSSDYKEEFNAAEDLRCEKEELLNCIEDLIFAFASRTVSSKRIHKELQCNEIKKAISLLEKHNTQTDK